MVLVGLSKGGAQSKVVQQSEGASAIRSCSQVWERGSRALQEEAEAGTCTQVFGLGSLDQLRCVPKEPTCKPGATAA